MIREREGKGKFMLRKDVFIAALLWLVASSQAVAIGLGEIDVQSSLNDPFRAVIELTSATDEELGELKVSIASPAAFDRAGIPRPQLLTSMLFRVERTADGKPVIRVSTKDPIHEPFLDFLLEMAWSRGRMLRQYTVLIDPPYTMPAVPVAPRAPVTPAPQPVAEPVPPPAPVRRPAPAPSQVKPVMPAPVPETTSQASASNYGPVRRNETLWVIAKRVRPDSDITMDQMMQALLRANPGAFIDNNINNLKAGAVLAVPERNEIVSLDPSQARRETSRQYTEWKSARAGGKQETAASESENVTPVADTETRLQLVAPETDAIDEPGVPGTPQEASQADTEATDLQSQLAIANEEAEANRAQSGELQARVDDLEGQMTDMQRLLELKDAQLASMQNRLDTENDVANTVETAPAAAEQASANEEEAAGKAAESTAPVVEEPNGLVDRLLDNPVLTALGVLVAMILGGFLWASTRQRRHSDIFSDEPTLASRLAEIDDEPAAEKPDFTAYRDSGADDMEPGNISPIEGDADGDPITEADVFIAYGRIQQAEDVIQGALRKSPEDMDLKLKLLEIYHAAGNAAAFDTHAEGVRRSVDANDPIWEKIAVMGYELSPDNPAYKSGGETMADPDSEVDFDMDLSGMDDETRAGDADVDDDLGLDYADAGKSGNDLPESIEFNLDDLDQEAGAQTEDASEGLLDNSDEVSTKLDLARAYVDMGDPESARNILEEVLEEGNEEQKSEAKNLYSQIS